MSLFFSSNATITILFDGQDEREKKVLRKTSKKEKEPTFTEIPAYK